MQNQRGHADPPRLDSEAEPVTGPALAGFAVVGSRAHLPPDLEHRATHVTPRAFSAWCDGSIRVVVFGDAAFRELDPEPVKASLAAHGVVAVLCPIDSGWADFSRWALAEVGDVAAPAELPGLVRAALEAQSHAA